MDLRTALGVEHKRREAEEAVETALKEASKAETEEEAAAEEAGIERPSAKKRFQNLGKRIIALADEKEALGLPDGTYTGDLHQSFTEIGVEGLAIVAKAREGYTPGSLRGRELNFLDVAWQSSAYVTGTPFARQEIGLLEVRDHNVTPEVYGLLRLMEQSIDVVELARQGTQAA